jgi:hypothetical protein
MSDAAVTAGGGTRPRLLAGTGLARAGALLALAAFAALCVAVLVTSARANLVEPDDHAYQASIIGVTQGHLTTLSTAQARALAARAGGSPFGVPVQWVQLSGGRWISEKDPGYPYLAAPFQALGIIRLTPLLYGAIGALGLFLGARRWLGPLGGAAAVGLYCSSGAALLFAWRDYMPTFTDASLIAAGTGTLLWALLAADAPVPRRTAAGLAAFVALEAAAFTRYTDVVVLAVAVVAVLAAWRRVPRAALAWWLGSVGVYAAGTALFDDLVYSGPLTTGYRPGEITFSLAAIGPNLRYLPGHLISAMPLLVPGLAAAAWIAVRGARRAAPPAARRDLAVGAALAASWLGIWGLYAAYTWTAHPFLLTLQAVRFYVPALGAMSLLGAWLVTRLPARAAVAVTTTAAVVAGLFGLGWWSFDAMRSPASEIGRVVFVCGHHQLIAGPPPVAGPYHFVSPHHVVGPGSPCGPAADPAGPPGPRDQGELGQPGGRRHAVSVVTPRLVAVVIVRYVS